MFGTNARDVQAVSLDRSTIVLFQLAIFAQLPTATKHASASRRMAVASKRGFMVRVLKGLSHFGGESP